MPSAGTDEPSAESSVGELAARLLGSRDVTVSAVATPGMETHAYRVSDGVRTGCLRIGHSVRGFLKDRWAYERFGAALPIPQVWELGMIDDQRAFCLTAWAPGVTLQDLSAPDVETVLSAVFEAWTVIRDADTTKFAGFGELDPDLNTAPYRSWRELLQAQAQVAASWRGDWPHKRSADIAAVISPYEALIERCPEVHAFVHGDWGSNNILVLGGKITGILDWEGTELGDPLQDVSGRFWAFWPPVAACVSLLATYSERKLGHLPDYAARSLCFDLRRGLGEIDGALANGHEHSADRFLDRCLQLITASALR